MKRTQVRNSLLSTGVQVCWDQPGFPILRQHWSVAFVAEAAEQFVSALCPSACLQILQQWEKSNPANSNSNNYILAIPSSHKNTALTQSLEAFPSSSMHTCRHINIQTAHFIKGSKYCLLLILFCILVFSLQMKFLSQTLKIEQNKQKGPGAVFVKKHTTALILLSAL